MINQQYFLTIYLNSSKVMGTTFPYHSFCIFTFNNYWMIEFFPMIHICIMSWNIILIHWMTSFFSSILVLPFSLLHSCWIHFCQYFLRINEMIDIGTTIWKFVVTKWWYVYILSCKRSLSAIITWYLPIGIVKKRVLSLEIELRLT